MPAIRKTLAVLLPITLPSAISGAPLIAALIEADN